MNEGRQDCATEAAVMEGSKMDTEGIKVETAEKMNKGIAMAYDVQSKIMEEIFGDHFHIGFYDSSSEIPGSDVRSAQTRIIEAALRFASVSEDPSKKPKNVLDVGCGIGGTSRYLASKYGCECKGITLSLVEAERAGVLTAAQGLESQISYEVADALNQPFEDGSFDLIWCIECADHISDKTKFVQELNRVAAPGAIIILLTWCHRDLSPLEQDLHPDEKKLLNEVGSRNRVKWISLAEYINLFESCPLEDIKYADWSPYVAPHYAKLRKLMLSWKGIMSYAKHVGWRQLSIKALMMRSPFDIFKNGLLKYCILTCRKPQ